MPDFLRLTVKPDTDGTTELLAEVTSSGFCGQGAAWFNLSELEQFSVHLANTYPLLESEPLAIRGGFWSKTTPAVLEQERLGIEFYPIGLRGELGCRIHLATPLYEHDRSKSQHSVAVELKTSYEEVKVFSHLLIKLVRGENSEAILHAVQV